MDVLGVRTSRRGDRTGTEDVARSRLEAALGSVRARTALGVSLMVAVILVTTVVGVARTGDHKSRLQRLEETSVSAATVEVAHGQFLHATTSLAALSVLRDPSYFGAYAESMDQAQAAL